MIEQLLITSLISFAFAAILGPVMIPFLQRLKAGQTVRDDGPKTHLAKNGTPTMGGFIFLVPFAIVSVALCLMNKVDVQGALIVIGTVGFAVIGFIDDYIKVVLKRSLGLRAWQKFGLQIVLTVAIMLYMQLAMGSDFSMIVPFAGISISLGVLIYPAMIIIVVGTVNGSNFTDGLDGLDGKVTAVISVYFMIAACVMSDKSALVSAAMLGALLGFLLYNSHKASVFMGDTGSLALGGYVAMVAVILHLELFIIIVAFIYLAEVCSVILQVGYFKISHGKRIFRMAPIHHHFELGGWKETKVVSVFTITTIILCAVGILAL